LHTASVFVSPTCVCCVRGRTARERFDHPDRIELGVLAFLGLDRDEAEALELPTG